MKSPTKWNWYGTWVLDWLTCDRGNYSDDAWSAFGIWKKAYIEAYPELSDASDLELIEGHYCPAMEPVFNSFVFAIYLALHWPTNAIRSTAWKIRRQLFFV